MDLSLDFSLFVTSAITSVNLAHGTDTSHCLTDSGTQLLKMFRLFFISF